jgi:hypothetical protein
MLPDGVARLWVVIDAAVSVTFARAQADPGRVVSRDPEFHHTAHRRFRKLLSSIPADRVFESQVLTAEQIASAIAEMLGVESPGGNVNWGR